MKKKFISYGAITVIACGLLLASALSNDTVDENTKKGDIIYLNKQRATIVGAEGEAKHSNMFAIYDKSSTGVEHLRFVTAVQGNIDSIKFTMASIGDHNETEIDVEKVYRGLEVEGKTLYYDGTNITDSSTVAGSYYWAVFNIEYKDLSSVSAEDNVSMSMTINGNESVSLASSLSSSKLGGGDGSETNPYLIYSQASYDEYASIAGVTATEKNFNEKYISLVTDSVVVTTNNRVENFYGIFNGNQHTLNVNIDAEGVKYGNGTSIFGVNRSGTIKNLIVDGTIQNSVNNAAGIVGINDGTLENCVNKASISFTEGRAGGITSFTRQNSKVINCFNYGTISGNSVDDNGSTINNLRGVGGIIGTLQNNSTAATNIQVEGCMNYGNVHNGYQTAGGIVGVILSNGSKVALTGTLTIDNCKNYGEVSSDSGFVGGIVGTLDNKNIVIQNCYNEGKISGRYFVGGIAGALGYSSTVSNDKDGTKISNCENKGEVTATQEHGNGGYRVGGITGMAYGTEVTGCISTGKVVGGETEASGDLGDKTTYIGLFIGYKTSTANFTK